jgi:predicted dehydrogenase
MATVDALRIAIVGCGAVTELAHLPICTKTDGVRVVALVDTNLERANNLASDYEIPTVLQSARELAGIADAAIVAVPHKLHADISGFLLRSGVHVLVEKPMAISTAECDQMIEAAEAGRAVLAVGLMRRFAPWARYVKDALAAHVIGKLRSFEVHEGTKYSWPVASDFFFRKDMAGGGVLIDTGAHTLDTILWWFGDHQQLEYYDDDDGGVEADCEVQLKYANELAGRVEFSRTRNLGFTFRIVGDLGVISVEPNKKKRVTIKFNKLQLAGDVVNPDDWMDNSSYLSLMAASLNDWISAIRQGRSPFVDGHQGRRAVATIEECYTMKKPLVFPWIDPN